VSGVIEESMETPHGDQVPRTAATTATKTATGARVSTSPNVPQDTGARTFLNGGDLLVGALRPSGLGRGGLKLSGGGLWWRPPPRLRVGSSVCPRLRSSGSDRMA